MLWCDGLKNREVDRSVIGPARLQSTVMRSILNHGSSGPSFEETKIGVAVRFEGYEYLNSTIDSSSASARISSLHPHHEHEEDRPLAHSAVRP